MCRCRDTRQQKQRLEGHGCTPRPAVCGGPGRHARGPPSPQGGSVLGPRFALWPPGQRTASRQATWFAVIHLQSQEGDQTRAPGASPEAPAHGLSAADARPAPSSATIHFMAFSHGQHSHVRSDSCSFPPRISEQRTSLQVPTKCVPYLPSHMNGAETPF